MAYKAPGPCSLYREQVAMQGASYSQTPGADSDDFKFTAITEGQPAFQNHVHDNTAYSTQPTYDNWQEWLAHGNQV